MSQSYEPSLEPEALQSALEASCDALMTLQSIEHGAQQGEEETSPAHRHLIDAIVSLRSAIEDLRLACGEDASVVGHGFVVRAGPALRPRPTAGNGQVRPRRTA